MRNLTGLRFGRLVVVEKDRNNEDKTKGIVWVCKCDCGNHCSIRSTCLLRGKTKSCGCYRKEVGKQRGESSRTHGEGMNGKETVEYRTWASMLSRCSNHNHVLFKNYGARGISVCNRWQSYANFLEDMGRRPEGKYSLDRIDNNGNYEPDNCRWATSIEQNRNTRGCRYITIDGDTRSLAEWLEVTGTSRDYFYGKIKAGKSEYDALRLFAFDFDLPAMVNLFPSKVLNPG